MNRHFKPLLAVSAIFAIGIGVSRAQQVNPGGSFGSGSVTLNAGTNSVGTVGLNAGTASVGTVGLNAGTNAIGSVSINPSSVTATDFSGTVTAGGTFQTPVAANVNRKGCIVQNPFSATEPLYVFYGSGTPSTTNSIALGAGGIFNCNAGGNAIETSAVQVTGATTGHVFVAKAQ